MTIETDKDKMHQCKKCGSMLSVDRFPKDRKMKSGHLNSCKKCENTRRHEGRAENPDRTRLQAKIYRLKNPDVRRNRDRIKYAQNVQKMRERRRLYRLKDVEKTREQERAYYRKNLEHNRKKARESGKRRKDKIAKYSRDRYQNNLNCRLKILLSGRILSAIKQSKASKQDRTLNLVGCSIEFLKGYIYNLFKPGMSWHNHGSWERGGPMTWHIDHIRPCSSFDLKDPAQQKACFHYTNLQPLWAPDNMSKHNSFTP